MNIQDILDIGDFTKQVEMLTPADDTKKTDVWQKEYDGEHAILEDTTRDKTVGEGSEQKLVKGARQIVPFQKKIVRLTKAFLFGSPVILTTSDDSGQESLDAIKAVWKQNKLDAFNKKLMQAVCIETEAAELWYVKTDPEGTVIEPKQYKVMLLCEKTGNQIFPHFNDYGDMDAFTRKFEIEELVDGKAKKFERVEIYTAEKIITGTKKSEWEVKEVPNIYGKIQIIYYKQDAPEWKDVQILIDRMELLISRHADVNDYFGAPIIKIKGEVIKMPSKSQDGRVLQFKPIQNGSGGWDYGDADYLTWNQTPESIKLEYGNLKDLIYSMTSTPDVSFDNVKAIGNVSGIALKLMFMDAMTKAQEKQEIYGEGLTRRVNLLKAMISGTDVKAGDVSKGEIEIEFTSPLPENFVELIESLSVARGGEATMSKETAVKKNSFVDDVEAEIKAMESEASETASLGESYEV